MVRRFFAASFFFVLSACVAPVLPGSPLPRWVPGRVLVKFRDDGSPARIKDARIRIGAQTWERLPLANAELLSLDGTVDVPAALDRLREFDDVVEYAEPDFLFDPAGTPAEYDPDLLWGLAKIDAPEAWARSEGDRDVVVAVIDSGFDESHRDLTANLWTNPNEIADGKDDDGDGYPDDLHGWDFVNGTPDVKDIASHGTAVAGTIGAVGENGGIVGVAPRVALMDLKVLGADGGRASDAIRAIAFAQEHDALLINASWGGRGYSNALRTAITKAGEAGILFIAAAGNGAQNGIGENTDRSPVFPAAYGLPNVISVAASDSHDELAAFSNYGPSSVDLAAPGVGIISTAPGDRYAYYEGTSLAAPHVTGAAVLLLTTEPEITVDQLKQALLASVKKGPALNGRIASGGRLDLPAALSAAHDLVTRGVAN